MLLLALAACDSDPTRERPLTEGGGSVVARPERTWHGGEDEDEAGQAVAAGDMDGDGVAELLLGAPSGFVYGTDVLRSRSGAYLVRGDAPPGALDDVAVATFLGWKNG